MRRILLSVLFLVNLGWLPPATAAGQVLRMHHDMPADSALHKGVMVFKQLVEARSQGQYRVEVFAANSLGDDLEVVQQLQIGAVQAAPIPSAKLSNLAPALQMLDLPFLFASEASADRFMDGPAGKRLLATLPARGLVGASFWESGFKQMTCQNVLGRPSGLKGAHVRVMESPILAAQFRAVGGLPVTVSFAETYIALQQGMVNCQENPIVSIAKMRLHEVQNEIWLSRHGYLGYVFLFSQHWLRQQPPAMQAVLMQAARDAALEQWRIAREEESAYLETIMASGKVRQIDNPALLARLRNDMRAIYPQFRHAIGAGIFDASLADLAAQGGK